MALSADDRRLISAFRDAVERRVGGDERFGPPARDDRPDDATLATRFPVGDKLWIELTVRPFVPQVRAGIVTDDRWRNEDLEDKIEESGDTMQEFVEMGFEEAGLEWLAPPVEHYREQGKFFCFSTGVELEALGRLADADVLDKSVRMLEGYYEAFKPAILKAGAAG